MSSVPGKKDAPTLEEAIVDYIRPPDGMTTSEVASYLGIDMNTVIRLLCGLVADGRIDVEYDRQRGGMRWRVATVPVWTEGVCGDGAAILRHGQMVPITDVLAILNRLEAQHTGLLSNAEEASLEERGDWMHKPAEH